MYAPAPSSTGRMRQRSRPEGNSSLIEQKFGASPERDGAECPRDCRSTLKTGQGGGERWVSPGAMTEQKAWLAGAKRHPLAVSDFVRDGRYGLSFQKTFQDVIKAIEAAPARTVTLGGCPQSLEWHTEIQTVPPSTDEAKLTATGPAPDASSDDGLQSKHALYI
ncbi:hypothetical protein CH63R_05164 [Colletotrichum higginsianum IMI 349063]|uniref:Uncharacterized protein n=1 Tax=Colletotrichum higginsianum (strain IMI 349063) TaxID=759273 RepID=A0A1B7YLS7_COLHI|nr:hypothetical protein CH63R_05164 [Colletotrichum higginsianum IMI 349063]OBR12868.1 hypothetical protein CH63R_05164 [Colletotrichum higginsianum IMI 349063]